MKLYTLTLTIDTITSRTGDTYRVDEPALLYEVHQTRRHAKEWHFRQFVRGDLTESREWWQDMIEGLERIATPPDLGKMRDRLGKKEIARRRAAAYLVRKIADRLIDEPDEVTEAVPDVPARAEKQLVMDY